MAFPNLRILAPSPPHIHHWAWNRHLVGILRVHNPSFRSTRPTNGPQEAQTRNNPRWLWPRISIPPHTRHPPSNPHRLRHPSRQARPVAHPRPHPPPHPRTYCAQISRKCRRRSGRTPIPRPFCVAKGPHSPAPQARWSIHLRPWRGGVWIFQGEGVQPDCPARDHECTFCPTVCLHPGYAEGGRRSGLDLHWHGKERCSACSTTIRAHPNRSFPHGPAPASFTHRPPHHHYSFPYPLLFQLSWLQPQHQAVLAPHNPLRSARTRLLPRPARYKEYPPTHLCCCWGGGESATRPSRCGTELWGLDQAQGW